MLPRPPCGSVLSLFFLRLLFLLLIVAAVFFLFLSSLCSTRPILRLASSRRTCSRTQAPGDKLWVYKHALYFLPLSLSLVCVCVCCLKDKVLFQFLARRHQPLSAHQSPSIPWQRHSRRCDSLDKPFYLFISLFICLSIQKASFSSSQLKSLFYQGQKHHFGVERIPINLEVVCLVSPHQINYMQEGNREKIVSPLKRNLSELQ